MNHLREGVGFGELALMDDNKFHLRRFTVRALGHVDVISVPNTVYAQVLKRKDERRFSKLVDFLLSLQYFKSHTKNGLLKFAQSMHNVKFKRNQAVYTEGDFANKVWVVY